MGNLVLLMNLDKLTSVGRSMQALNATCLPGDASDVSGRFSRARPYRYCNEGAVGKGCQQNHGASFRLRLLFLRAAVAVFVRVA